MACNWAIAKTEVAKMRSHLPIVMLFVDDAHDNDGDDDLGDVCMGVDDIDLDE